MDINGKSANLNNCLKKVFGHLPKKANGEIDWTEISNKEVSCLTVVQRAL